MRSQNQRSLRYSGTSNKKKGSRRSRPQISVNLSPLSSARGRSAGRATKGGRAPRVRHGGGWSVDRLGRSLKNLVEVLGELHAKGVDLYLHLQGLDTSTPSGRAMFQMMGVFAEFERAIIRERVRAGIERAKAEGVTLGRPSIEDSNAGKYEAIKAALAAKQGIRRIARELQTGIGTVLRIKAELAA